MSKMLDAALAHDEERLAEIRKNDAAMAAADAVHRGVAAEAELGVQQADEAARQAGDLERDRNKAQRLAAENDRRALHLQVQDLRCLGYL